MLVLIGAMTPESIPSVYAEFARSVFSCGRIIDRQEVTRLVLSLPVDAQSFDVEEGHLSVVASMSIKACVRNRHPRRRRPALPTIEWSQAPPSAGCH